MPTPSRRSSLLGLLLIGLLPAAASDQGRTFEETARVVEVRLPVHVIDKSGHPVRGLTREAFQVRDGRQRREILGFQVIDLEIEPPDPGPIWRRQALDAAARRHFLLLFDLTFSEPASMVRARLAAREFVLGDLHPSDLVAVATHSVDRGARLLATFTSDRARIARTIDALGGPELSGTVADDPVGYLERDGDRPEGPIISKGEAKARARGAAGQMEADSTLWVLEQQMEKADRSQSEGHIAAWSRSLGEMARMLASVPGQKQVLYFSEGFDGQLLFGRQQSLADQGGRDLEGSMLEREHWATMSDDLFGSTGLLHQVNQMLDSFRKSNCALQVVDVSGLESGDRREDRLRSARRHALFYIARETGGELFADTNELSRLIGQVLHRSAVTYLLTFSAADVPEDGSFRPVAVKVALPDGGQVLAPPGYNAPRPFVDLHPIEKTLLASEALAAAVPVSDVALDLLAVPFPAGERAYVPVIVEVPGGPLAAGMDGDRLPLELYAYATDAAGEIVDAFTQILALELAANRQVFLDGGAKFYGHFELFPGEHLVRVLVRNRQTGRTGVAVTPLDVPDFARAEPVLLPPLFTAGAAGWVLIREKEPTEAESVVYPFTVGGDPFIPAARPTLQPEESSSLCLFLYNLAPGTAAELDSSVLTADGDFAAGGTLSSVAWTATGIEGLDKATATFRPDGLAPGDYLLQVELTDPTTGLTEVSSIPFRMAPG